METATAPAVWACGSSLREHTLKGVKNSGVDADRHTMHACDDGSAREACMISSKSVAGLIQDLNELDETEDLEAKTTALGDVGDSVYETICALSNEPDLGGGTILLGVQKEFALFPLFTVVGVADPDKAISDLSSGCASMFNTPVRPDITQEKVSAKTVVRVDVPELNASQKPLYIKRRGLPRGAFRRIGSSDQRCTDEDLTAFFQTKAQDPFDSHVVEGLLWDDIDESAVEQYRRARKDANPYAEELKWSDEEVLHALGGAKRNNDEMNITATGLLVFGQAMALRRVAPAHRVDYIRVPGKEWLSSPDQYFESVDMRGPLLNIIPRVMTAIIDDLPRTFRVDDESGKRVDVPVIPSRVIREAVVNAVMHRNYQVSQPVQVVRYTNRLEIRNPGHSLKSQDRFDEPGSAIRNPHIAGILHETKYAETKGSGIRVMREKMAQSGLTAPTFSSNRDNDEFLAIFLFHHFLSEEDWQWLANFKSFGISEDQMRALIFVREVGAIDNSAYRSLSHVDTLTASRSLRRLREQDILEDRGSGSRTYYVAGPVMRDLAANDDASIHVKPASMDVRGNGATSVSDLPTGLRVRLQGMRRRVEPHVMEALIIDLCSWKPLSAEELASLLDKTTNYISSKYLYKMVREKKLKHLYPEMVKHPRQKYLAGDSHDRGAYAG